MSLSANRIWRQLPTETRNAASRVFWENAPNQQKQFFYGALAKAKNVREISVRRAPIDRLANWTAATLNLPEQISSNLLQDYLLREHLPTIVKYLELLAIPHSEGIIEENFDLTSLSKEKVQAAARTLLESADRPAAELYLKYLVVQGGPWTAVEEALPTENS